MKNREFIVFLFLLGGENGKNGAVQGHVDHKRSLGLESCTNYRGMHRILAVFTDFLEFSSIFLSQEVSNHHFFQLFKIKNVTRNIIKDESHMKMLKNDDQNHFGSRCHHPCLPI